MHGAGQVCGMLIGRGGQTVRAYGRHFKGAVDYPPPNAATAEWQPWRSNWLGRGASEE